MAKSGGGGGRWSVGNYRKLVRGFSDERLRFTMNNLDIANAPEINKRRARPILEREISRRGIRP